MDRIAAYCYGISAVATACIVENSSSPEFWQDRPWTSMMLASAIPMNLGLGWLMEHRPITAPINSYKIACTCGISIGLIGIGLFILSVSHLMGAGFFVSFTITLMVIAIVIHEPVSKESDQNPNGSED